MCKLLRKSTYQRRRLSMAYHFSLLFPFVSMILGDFFKRISPVTMQQPVGSEYPTWVSQDGAPSGAQPPASLSCLTLSPFDIPYGSTSPPGGGASRSYSW